MAGKFELRKSESGKFIFNLTASNGKVILTSQLYEARTNAMGGIEWVKKNAASDANYERKTSSGNEPYFVLKAVKRQVIGKSEMYSSAKAMKNGITSVKTNGPDGMIVDLTR